MSQYIIADPVAKNVTKLKSLILEIDQQAQILHTKSGSGIFELLNSEIPDVIFINHTLADLSGFEICKKSNSASIRQFR